MSRMPSPPEGMPSAPESFVGRGCFLQASLELPALLRRQRGHQQFHSDLLDERLKPGLTDNLAPADFLDKRPEIKHELLGFGASHVCNLLRQGRIGTRQPGRV